MPFLLLTSKSFHHSVASLPHFTLDSLGSEDLLLGIDEHQAKIFSICYQKLSVHELLSVYASGPTYFLENTPPPHAIVSP